MADPTVINPTPVGNGHGLSALTELITEFESNLVTLRGAKEILERHG